MGGLKEENGLTLRHPAGTKSPIKRQKFNNKISKIGPLPKNKKRLSAIKLKEKILEKNLKKQIYVNRFATKQLVSVVPSDTCISPAISIPELPMWGGNIKSKIGQKFTLTQTCPVDNFLALLTIDKDFSNDIKLNPSCPRFLSNVISSLNLKKFSVAKMLIYNETGRQINNYVLNFEGNEHEMFLNLLSPFFSMSLESKCNSTWCPHPTDKQIQNKVQGLPHNINEFLSQNTTICHRAMKNHTEGAIVDYLPSVDAETGLQ